LIAALGTVAAVGLAMVATEWRSGGRTQSSVGRILRIHAAVALAWAILAVALGVLRPLPMALFWSGAVLLWIGVRAHLESSILLDLVERLDEGPAPASALIDDVGRAHGLATRLGELERGGFVSSAAGGSAVTARGAALLRGIDRLTHFWPRPGRGGTTAAP
jgi:hypothetical protein